MVSSDIEGIDWPVANVAACTQSGIGGLPALATEGASSNQLMAQWASQLIHTHTGPAMGG